MNFDWLSFFRKHHVEFVTRGPNVAKGNVNIHCPFCGAADPSHHMGVSTTNASWGCWRNPQHRGRSPVRLICALIRCTKAEALQICGMRARNVVPHVGDSVSALFSSNGSPSSIRRTLALPDSFKPFDKKPSFAIFYRYLARRGYTDDQIFSMSRKYGLRYCTAGPFKGRVIFPVYFEGRLVSWTGRTVYQAETVRYKTLTADPEKAEKRGLSPALGPINDYLLWYDDLLKGTANTVFLVEGPFDALKVRVLGRRLGVTATCFFTQAPTRVQIGLLAEKVLPRFRRRWLVLDQGSMPIATRVKAKFAALDVKLVSLPEGVKDPGELGPRELLALLENNF